VEYLKEHWPILVAIVQVVMGWLLWSLRKEFVTGRDCSACRSTCRKEVAEDMQKLPSIKSIADLAKEMEGLRGDLKAQAADIRGLSEVLKRVEHPLDLLLEHQLAEGRRDRRGE
jgi:hypothetical protein